MKFSNKYVEIEIQTSPVFRVRSFVNRSSGNNVFSSVPQILTCDRRPGGEPEFVKEEKLSDTQYVLTYRSGSIRIERHLFFYETAPVFRWYDVCTAETACAAVYYSDLAAIRLDNACKKGTVYNFFSCSDQSNRRLIEQEAKPGKFKGSYFFGNGMFLYKEGPWPDCQPIPGEYDFEIGKDMQEIHLLGLGFDNIRPGEVRRANGVVIGLSERFGLQRYWLSRYADFPLNSCCDVLSNSWPDLTFGVNEKAIAAELRAAAESGISCVFIDDGWFSTFMGEIDKEKFPNSFTKLSADAKKLGVEIGLWCDPLGMDIRDPRVVVWDGAECHDTMLEGNPWNWAARNQDFHYTYLEGGAQSPRSYVPLETMRSDVKEYIINYITRFYKEFGIRHFKFDLYRLAQFDTMLGDAHLHYEVYRQILTEIQQQIPDLIISMDVTRRSRPNFDFALDFGRLFLENRGRGIKDHRYYHPYMALGNFHYTMKLAPARQLEIEMMPQIDDYPLYYILGTTIFGAPLYWGSIVNTAPEKRPLMKDFFAFMKPFREDFARGINIPLGPIPDKGNSSAIFSALPDGSKVYLAAYRHGDAQNSAKFELPKAYQDMSVKRLFGTAEAALSGEKSVEVTFKEAFDFALFQLK